MQTQNVNSLIAQLVMIHAAISIDCELAIHYKSIMDNPRFAKREYRPRSTAGEIAEHFGQRTGLRDAALEKLIVTVAKQAAPAPARLSPRRVEPLAKPSPRSCGVSSSDWSPKGMEVAL